jgi:Fe2+ transport system protein FeoA
MTLDELPVNRNAIITKCDNVRFGDIGCACGQEIRVIAKASFGGPIAFRVGSDTFAFKIEEAKQIEVELL